MRCIELCILISLNVCGFAQAGWIVQPTPAQSRAVSTPSEEPSTSRLEDESCPIQILDAVMAPEIRKGLPMGVAQAFSDQIGRLYCYTDTFGGQAGDHIHHHWFKDGQLMGMVNLRLGGSPWQTWSSWPIHPGEIGNWTVEVYFQNTKLDTLAFRVYPAKATHSLPLPRPEAEHPSAPGWSHRHMHIEEMVVAREIKDRQPVEAGDRFPADVGCLYCFTYIQGGQAQDRITHRWRRGQVVMDEIQLTVRSASWRTWSMKTIPAESEGQWAVDVMAYGEVLKTVTFTLE